jgi:hypothetical protein
VANRAAAPIAGTHSVIGQVLGPQGTIPRVKHSIDAVFNKAKEVVAGEIESHVGEDDHPPIDAFFTIERLP